MKEETKAILETIIKREADETDLKIFEILTEYAVSKEKQNPVKFSVEFGKKCFEMGWDAFKEFSGE